MQIYIKNVKNPDNIHDCQGFGLKLGNCLATNAQNIKQIQFVHSLEKLF